jgi:hypothetical protein
MMFITLPKITPWGNLHSRLPGAPGLSPFYGANLRALFLFRPRVAGMAARLRPPGCISSVFLRPFQRDVLVYHCFLRRPQVLTRSIPLPTGRDISPSRQDYSREVSCVTSRAPPHWSPAGRLCLPESSPTATLECIAKICSCKMAVLQGLVTRLMSV